MFGIPELKIFQNKGHQDIMFAFGGQINSAAKYLSI